MLKEFGEEYQLILFRYLFEVKARGFTGQVSALVQKEISQPIGKKLGKGSALLIYSTNTKQGFSAQMLGNPSRGLEDIEGLLLVRTR